MHGSELRLLALDGGGGRGLSALMMLEEMIEAVNPGTTPKPCDYLLVCATSKETSETVCVTSYHTPRDLLNNVAIWATCRATSAASSFFDPLAIARFGEQFINGATGDVLPIGKTLVETKQTAKQFRHERPLLDNTGRYYRFKVDRGLEDIGLEEAKIVKEMAAATRSYNLTQVKQITVSTGSRDLPNAGA
ncbi:hypothetical protein BDV95DRAFT_608207 [Massariosphaeria phaeospora]|uniref:PNPLA domain-containing protein n=1 Tax=Massariosphaeria phaeospora TaxID=100035 RepID=A0A7C8MCY8_9PLEO|nr:hypothetical protein BDV95DRAFT_608207 [Massariosphaeria phaeospora]